MNPLLQPAVGHAELLDFRRIRVTYWNDRHDFAAAPRSAPSGCCRRCPPCRRCRSPSRRTPSRSPCARCRYRRHPTPVPAPRKCRFRVDENLIGLGVVRDETRPCQPSSLKSAIETPMPLPGAAAESRFPGDVLELALAEVVVKAVRNALVTPRIAVEVLAVHRAAEVRSQASRMCNWTREGRANRRCRNRTRPPSRSACPRVCRRYSRPR